MSEKEDIDQRLERLEGATLALRPSPGFSARVMLAISAQAAPTFFETTWLSARRLLPITALFAVVAIGWAVQVDGTVDDELASSYAALELE